MSEETKQTQERSYILPLRRFLQDIAWVALIIWILVMIRSTMTAVDEIRKLRVSLTTQVAETGVGLTLQAKQIESDVAKLNITGTVLVDRLDSQLGKARVQIKAASTDATKSAKADRVQIEKVLRPAADAVTDMAKEVTESQKQDQAEKPPLIVQPAPVIVQTAPILPPPITAPKKSPAQNPDNGEKEPGIWKKLWRALPLHPSKKGN